MFPNPLLRCCYKQKSVFETFSSFISISIKNKICFLNKKYIKIQLFWRKPYVIMYGEMENVFHIMRKETRYEKCLSLATKNIIWTYVIWRWIGFFGFIPIQNIPNKLKYENSCFEPELYSDIALVSLPYPR
jgi:hypothetical protein